MLNAIRPAGRQPAGRGDIASAVNASLPSNSRTPKLGLGLAARLIGSDSATVAGITVRGQAPILALCRALIAAGFHPGLPLQCHRGAMLCLTVRAIGEGANLTIDGKGSGSTMAAPVFSLGRGRNHRATVHPKSQSRIDGRHQCARCGRPVFDRQAIRRSIGRVAKSIDARCKRKSIGANRGGNRLDRGHEAMTAHFQTAAVDLLADAIEHTRPLLAESLPTKKRIRILWATAKQSRDLAASDVLHSAFMVLAIETALIDRRGFWIGNDVRESVRKFGAEDVAHVITWALRGWNPFEKGPLT